MMMLPPANQKDIGWYWAAASGDGLAGERFVVAKSQGELWPRVRREIRHDEQCAWMPIGDNGRATFEDCFVAFYAGRENYGASLNRVTLELARVPAWARWIQRHQMGDLCNYVSNPSFRTQTPLETYSRDAQEALRQRVAATLNIEPDKVEEYAGRDTDRSAA
jgi:hypothetical protein